MNKSARRKSFLRRARSKMATLADIKYPDSETIASVFKKKAKKPRKLSYKELQEQINADYQ